MGLTFPYINLVFADIYIFLSNRIMYSPPNHQDRTVHKTKKETGEQKSIEKRLEELGYEGMRKTYKPSG